MEDPLEASSSDTDIQEIAPEKPFLEYLHGYPGEPLWMTGILKNDAKYGEPDLQDLKMMLVNLRFQVQALFAKKQVLKMKLENSEQELEETQEELSDKEDELHKMEIKMANLHRQFEAEYSRLNHNVDDAKAAAKREQKEFKSAMEKVATVYESERATLQKALLDSRQELSEVQTRLEDSVRETADVTENFKNFYEDYIKLEDELKTVENELVPLQQEIHELAEAMKVEPEDLLHRLRRLKTAIKDGDGLENCKDLFFCEMVQEKEKMGKVSGRGSASSSQSDIQQSPASSTELEGSDASCPGSEKVLVEEADNAMQEVTDKGNGKERRKDSWPKHVFKIPKWSRRRSKKQK